jgi:hypothetical protein
MEQLKWKHSREFEFNGEMYDIVEEEMTGDTMHYWCWWDNEETRLNQQLDDLISKSSGTNKEQKQTQQRLSQFFHSLYITFIPASLQWIPKINRPDFKYHFNIKTIDISPPNPPPEIA